jgi:[calcium/calmodulin-dependent protein kinase] kinase
LYSDVKPNKSPLQGAVTADNTPISSPGLFALPRSSSATLSEEQQMHHLQKPKETNTVEIEHDVYSGNKFINNYEIVSELGRGEHGKVKLARNMENGHHVAVKIVPRFSRQRRLMRLGAPEDQTKREVAVLKKARHPNVVSLIEVIDDPNKNKVYLILEYVERGEILWRKKGVHEIVKITNRRLEAEKAGLTLSLEPTEKELYDVELAKRRHEYNEKKTYRPPLLRDWSLEHTGEDDNRSEISRTASRQDIPSRTQSHDDFVNDDLAGSMYGAYSPEIYRERKFSIALSAISHLSSELDWKHDDEHSYVPALTMDEARRTFRDTLLGLEFLHFIGIIHRDIKPANLLVAKDWTVKISDFGVSYLGRPVSEEDDTKSSTKDVSEVDDERELVRSVGTPAFWAPEVCFEDVRIFEDGKTPRITGALDLWALGITLYCMIYARLPFMYNDDRGLHEAICHEDLLVPATRLVPVDMSSPDELTTHGPKEINSNKRLDFEVKFEKVPDSLRDLIKKLLIKDPAKRMTMLEAKKHPWVLEGEDDPKKFVSGPSLAAQPVETILQPDEKEVDRAVGKRSLVERAVATAGKIGTFAGSLLSRAGTLNRDSRKRASSTATSSSESVPSPASTVGKAKDSRRQSLKTEEFANQLKSTRDHHGHPLAQSESSSPQDRQPEGYFDDERRPRAPDRTISHADSIRTVRPPPGQAIPDIHREDQLDPGFLQTVENIIDTSTSAWNRLTSRTRYWGDRSQSLSRQSSESDIHGAPSLGLSTASVTGSIETPEILRSPVDNQVSPQRNLHSADSIHVPQIAQVEDFDLERTSIHAPASSSLAFEQAQELNNRRLIQETQAIVEAKAEAEAHPVRSIEQCPPSPDDETFLQQAQPSASTIASSADVSLNLSNPSFGIPSNASSPPTEGFLSQVRQAEEDAMKTSDTITERSVATGKALEQQYQDEEADDSEDEGMMMNTSKKR